MNSARWLPVDHTKRILLDGGDSSGLLSVVVVVDALNVSGARYTSVAAAAAAVACSPGSCGAARRFLC